jgi:hypothetical protein
MISCGDGLGGGVDTFQVVGSPGGRQMLTSAPDRELGHGYADDQDQHRGLDVGRAGDGEPLVGPCEEEVEPDGGRDGSQDPREAVACGCHSDHGEHEGQRGVGVGEARTEGHQDGGEQQREGEPGQHRKAIPPRGRPRSHNALVAQQRWAPPGRGPRMVAHVLPGYSRAWISSNDHRERCPDCRTGPAGRGGQAPAHDARVGTTGHRRAMLPACDLTCLPARPI